MKKQSIDKFDNVSIFACYRFSHVPGKLYSSMSTQASSGEVAAHLSHNLC